MSGQSDIAIRPIKQLALVELQSIISGYTSPARYRVLREESDGSASFRLDLVALPYVKRYDPSSQWIGKPVFVVVYLTIVALVVRQRIGELSQV